MFANVKNKLNFAKQIISIKGQILNLFSKRLASACECL